MNRIIRMVFLFLATVIAATAKRAFMLLLAVMLVVIIGCGGGNESTFVTSCTGNDEDSYVDYGALKQDLPRPCEMYDWINDLWQIGKKGFYGYRLIGTPENDEAAHYVENKYKAFGLQNVFLESAPVTLRLPKKWSLNVSANGENKVISCSFLRDAGYTPPNGISAPMVYVGQGSAAEFDAAGDVTGKIVVVDIIANPIPVDVLINIFAIYTYDPKNTLAGDNAIENWPPVNLDSSYKEASNRGAAGYVANLTFTVKNNNQFLHWYATTVVTDAYLPGLTVSPTDGAYLKGLLAAGSVQATMTLTGSHEEGSAYNVYGIVPGKNYGTDADQFIVVHTHYDGWACNDASGVSVVLAIAKYFSKQPKETRNYSILFSAFGNHMSDHPSWDTYPNYVYSLVQQNKLKFAAPIEMIAKQYKIVNGQYVYTGLTAPNGLMTNDMPASMIKAASDALPKYDLDRTIILKGYFNGETEQYSTVVPTIGHISENAPQFSSDDTPDTVMKSDLRKTTAVYVDIIQAAQTAF